ncbi:MAG: hypothetical protein KatS3mg065_1188 [Chloroflexota bacterium]|nr:MAG: hypothetical protein KatS3mg065_1188 [Chloroflexota bacterium]
MMRELRRLAIAAALTLVLSPPITGAARAHTPIRDASRQYPSSDPILEWAYSSSSYPTWLTTAIDDALNDTATHNALWDSPSHNNSRIQNFTKSSSGTGRIVYSDDPTSPCTGSSTWLMCADNDHNNDGSRADWLIYVRNFDKAPMSTNNVAWRWRDDGSPTSLITFDVRRNVLHEAVHITMDVDAHDPQGWTVTLMNAISPDDNDPGWNTRHLEKCDQARAQMIFDVEFVDGPIAQCFDHVTGAGSNGLNTALTLRASASHLCLGQDVLLSGTLSIETNDNYRALSGNVLGSRQVAISLNGAPWATRTSGATTGGYSISVGFSTAGTRTFLSSFANEGAGALTGTSSPSVSVSWSQGC